MSWKLMKKSGIPEGESGKWKVEKFTVSEEDAKFHNLRCIISISNAGRTIDPGTYTRLTENDYVVMSDTPAEMRDHMEVLYKAFGKVLINGLGLGLVTQAILRKPDVDMVLVNEISQDVINLVAPHIKHPKLAINKADAFTWHPNGLRFNTIWHDIWPHYNEDMYKESMKLHRRYSNWMEKEHWQGSWGRKSFLREW